MASFLNYCIVMFIFCTILMVVISALTKKPVPEQIRDLAFSKDTVAAGQDKTWLWIHVILSMLVVIITVSIWRYFA